MRKIISLLMLCAFVLCFSVSAYASPQPGTVPLYRYRSSSNPDHFFTTNFDELGNGNDDYIAEGIQCYVFASPQPGTVPLYRYRGGPDHFYTTDFNELGNGREGYISEGIQCYVFASQQPGTVPLYRYRNNQYQGHFYTTNFYELGNGKNGYVLEGIMCYVYPVRYYDDDSNWRRTHYGDYESDKYLSFRWHDRYDSMREHHHLERMYDHEWERRFPGSRAYRWHSDQGFWHHGHHVTDAMFFYNSNDELTSIGYMANGVFIHFREDHESYENHDSFFLSWFRH